MVTKLSILQESGKGRLGWQTPKPTTTENITPAKNPRAPSKMPSNSNSPKAPKFTEVYPRDTKRQVSESDENLQTMGSRDGKIEQ